jgi:hypothetical protein
MVVPLANKCTSLINEKLYWKSSDLPFWGSVDYVDWQKCES